MEEGLPNTRVFLSILLRPAYCDRLSTSGPCRAKDEGQDEREAGALQLCHVDLFACNALTVSVTILVVFVSRYI